MMLKRLAGLATLAGGLVFFGVLTHLYLQAPHERRVAVNESLQGFKTSTPKPRAVRTPPFCFKTFARRANRTGIGVVVKEKCIAHGIEAGATHALLARAVLEELTARLRM